MNRPAACSCERKPPTSRTRAPRSLPARQSRFVPQVEPLEDRTALTAFTMTSPVSRGELPGGVTAVGGVVLDLVGSNGRRVVSQLPASSLFTGTFNNGSPESFRGNPGTIGVQTGFTPETLNLLGGGLSELAVRLTVFDGDTAAGNFDFHDNELLLNDVLVGDFSDIVTQQTSQDGQTALSGSLGNGFRNNRLHTGFVYSAQPAVLDAFFASLSATGEVAYRLFDADPFDNLFDFTLGVDGGLVDVGTPPAVVNTPPSISAITTDGPGTEGIPVRVAVTATDPDTPDQPLTYDFDFDNDGTFETSGAAAAALHTFADEGSYVIPVRVRDADGGEALGSTTVEVRNAAPRLQEVSLPEQAWAGDTVTLTVRFTDPGTADTFTLVVEWDGTTTTALLPAGSSAYELTRVLDGSPGDRPVRVTLRDNSGGEVVAVASVLMQGPPPSVPSQPAPSPAPVDTPPEVPTPEVSRSDEQPPASPAPLDPSALLTAVLIASAPDINIRPAEPGQVEPPVTAIRTDTLILLVPPSPGRVITGSGEGIQGGSEQPWAPPPDTPARVGSWFSGWLLATLEQFLRDGAGEPPLPIVPAVVVDRPGVAVPIQQPDSLATAPAPQPAARTGTAVRVVVLLIAAVWLSGRWSAGPSSATDALRRRLGRKMAAFHRGQGG